MKRLFLLTFVAFLCAAPVAHAADESYLAHVDLILPPALETPDAPFYRGAKVKVDEMVLPVIEGKVAEGRIAEFQPENNVVVVSDSTTISETDKGQALLDVVSAMQIGDIATAAGQ